MRDPATLNSDLLAVPNILLRLDRPVHGRMRLSGKFFDSAAIRLDDPDPLVRLLLWRLAKGQ